MENRCTCQYKPLGVYTSRDSPSDMVFKTILVLDKGDPKCQMHGVEKKRAFKE